MTIFFNTRPKERADLLSQALRQAGVQVVDLPLLSLEPLPLTATQQDYLKNLYQGKYQVLLSVSPSASQLGLAYLMADRKKVNYIDDIINIHDPKQNKCSSNTFINISSKIVSVGQATARPFIQIGMPVITPKEKNATNEGMLALSTIQQLSAEDKVLIWRGQGGRKLLLQTLQNKGVQVDDIAWYHRVLPTQTKSLYQQWLKQFNYFKNETPYVLISSATAFDHWQQIVTQVNSKANTRPSLADFTYITLGERLTGILAKKQLCYRQVVNLSVNSVLQAM